MKIVINTRLLIKGRIDGISRFTYETVKRICQNHPEHQFYLLFDRMYSKEFIFGDNVKPIIVPFQARHPFLWWFWFHSQVPRVLNALKPDVFVSTDGYSVVTGDTPVVDVIHDLNFEHFPEHLPYLVRKYYQKYFPQYAQKATRIATVSEFSKNDIHTLYNIPLEKIDVVYNGVSSSFQPLLDVEKIIIKQKYTNSADYFVYAGTLHPRKNIEGLFAAFKIFKEKTQSTMKLVIVGESMFLAKTIQKAYDKHPYKKDIVFTGRVSDKDLNYLLGSAFAMTYVPFFEGFGIPILEAFACNIPVITSNCTSMPEVAGEAALLCDPTNVESIANAMIQLYSDKDLPQKLIAHSQEQLQKFTWDKTAELLWKSIENAQCVMRNCNYGL
ncbi:MAG: glycosyltransferase family 4 protein [Bacteroidales bacterium]|nr:glycosyltransferase family 4 protein [Bacteroidales bacterium]MBR4690799.1 glycosyltransferase family 4 protein [Bacteroidales bacterium]MBR4691119.1 glycosyltransferase family 4 protein [Bacteroidales bacterium]MBR7034572.1 glycosyltransferase family 4 protein [Bacteroidales bacterium]